MASAKKLTVIDKASRDRPDHVPLDPEQRAILVIYHNPTGYVIRTWGWTLNQVLAILEWSADDTLATSKRSWARNRGAILLTPSTGLDCALAKLNEQEE